MGNASFAIQKQALGTPKDNVEEKTKKELEENKRRKLKERKRLTEMSWQ